MSDKLGAGAELGCRANCGERDGETAGKSLSHERLKDGEGVLRQVEHLRRRAVYVGAALDRPLRRPPFEGVREVRRVALALRPLVRVHGGVDST